MTQKKPARTSWKTIAVKQGNQLRDARDEIELLKRQLEEEKRLASLNSNNLESLGRSVMAAHRIVRDAGIPIEVNGSLTGHVQMLADRLEEAESTHKTQLDALIRKMRQIKDDAKAMARLYGGSE